MMNRYVAGGLRSRALVGVVFFAIALLQTSCGGSAGGLPGDLAGTGESSAAGASAGAPGGDAGQAAAPPLTAAQLLGRWIAPPTDPGLSLVIGPASEDASLLEAWMLGAELRSLVRLQLRIEPDGALAIEGWRWPLGQAGAREAVRERGVLVDDRHALVLQASQRVLLRQALGGAPAPGSVAEAASAPVDPVGGWEGSFDAGRIRVALRFDLDGRLTGASSTGCGISGRWTQRASAPWVDVSLGLDCGGGLMRFSGIATVAAAGGAARALTLAMVDDDAGSALVMMLAR